MSRSDIQAGKAFVLLELKNELARGLANAQQEVKRFANQVTDVGRTLAGFGASITGPILGAAYHFAKTGDELDKMSARTGVAVEQLSALKFAAEQSGAGLGEIGVAMKAMQQRGFDPRNFEALADEIAGIEDPVKRASRTIEVFGRSGTMLKPMLDNFRELSAEAEELGIVMSTEQATSAAELTDAMNRTKQSVLSLAREIGAAVAPELKKMAAWIKEIIPPAREWIEANRETIVWLLKIGGAMTVVGGGMMILGKVILGTSAALGALKTAILLASKASMLLYANPALLGLAAVAAAVVAITLAMKASEAAAQAKQRALEQATAAAGRAHEAGQKMRAEDIDRLKRLEQLAEHQQRFGSLTTSQTEEAATIVGHLNGRYEGLGLTFDETTGKVGGLASAMDDMIAVMREMASIEMNKQIDAMKKSLYALDEQIATFKKKQKQSGGFDEAWGTSDWQSDLDAAQEQRLEQTQQLIALQEQFNRTQGGDMAGVVGENAAGTAGPIDQTADFAKHAEEMQQRIAAAGDARINKQFQSEVNAVRDRYSREQMAMRTIHDTDAAYAAAMSDLELRTAQELNAVESQFRAARQSQAEQAIETERKAKEEALRDVYQDEGLLSQAIADLQAATNAELANTRQSFAQEEFTDRQRIERDLEQLRIDAALKQYEQNRALLRDQHKDEQSYQAAMAALDAKTAQELSDARTQYREAQQQRELAAVAAEHEAAQQALQNQHAEADALAAATANLTQEQEESLQALRQRHASENASDAQQAQQQFASAQNRLAQSEKAERDRAAAEAEDLQKQIERQTLEVQFKNDPDGRQLALMELEHKWQMEAIAARTDLTEQERQNMAEMQEHLHGLKKDALDAEGAGGIGGAGATGRPKGMGDITGHSAARAAAIAYGTSQGPQERMAAGIDRMADRLDEVADAARDQTQATQEWAAAIQQWLAGMSYA